MFFFKKKKIPLTEFFPKEFVDIHSHLLPGIDDGAKDMEDSISLISKLRSYGIKNIITTPHILGDVYPNTSESITSKLAEVQTELKNRGINDIKFRAAAEYMLDEKFNQILESRKPLLTLKDNLVLVEMSYFSPPINLYDMLFKLQLKGYKPILAHPERYQTYHSNFKEFYKLKAAGCLFQLNLLSLTPHYGPGVLKTAEKLLEAQLYDFAGTDTHHHNHLELLQKVSTSKNKKQLDTLLQKNKYFQW